MDEFIGIIKLFAGNFAPQGWAFCQGQLLPINQYNAVFALLGTTYGGNGTTNFALPDLRCCVAVGGGMGAGPGLQDIGLGQRGGEMNHLLTQPEMPSHTHIATTGGSAGLKVSSANSSQGAATAGASIATPGTLNGRTFTSTLGFNTTTPDMTLNTASINTSSITVTNGLAGSSQPHNNMQPYLGLSYIICLQGIFPPRP